MWPELLQRRGLRGWGILANCRQGKFFPAMPPVGSRRGIATYFLRDVVLNHFLFFQVFLQEAGVFCPLIAFVPSSISVGKGFGEDSKLG